MSTYNGNPHQGFGGIRLLLKVLTMLKVLDFVQRTNESGFLGIESVY